VFYKLVVENEDLQDLLHDNFLINIFDELDGLPKIMLTFLSLYIESNVRTTRKIQNSNQCEGHLQSGGEGEETTRTSCASESGSSIQLDE